MPSFGTASRKKLDTCNDNLVAICELVIEVYDFSVLEGHRSDERQEELFRQNKSKLRAGQSKHNQSPSLAVDIAPYPIDWENRERFTYFAGYVLGVASQMGIDLRWGGDWDRDADPADTKFYDGPHFELL